MTWVRLALALQLLFFGGWTAREEYLRARAVTLLLESRPVDPRDLLSGQYMDLQYPIGRVDRALLDYGAEGEVAVLLTPGETVATAQGERVVWRVAEVSLTPDASLPHPTPDAVWVRGTARLGANVAYGIERYYFSEKRRDELERLRPPFFVEVQRVRDGSLRPVRLIGKP